MQAAPINAIGSDGVLHIEQIIDGVKTSNQNTITLIEIIPEPLTFSFDLQRHKPILKIHSHSENMWHKYCKMSSTE